MNDDMRAIVDRVKQQRQRLGYSYQDLANITGMSKSTLQRYETGGIKNLPLDRLQVLASALEVTPEYIMGWADETEPDIFSIPNILPIEIKKIPLLGEIACGEPAFADEDFQGYVEVGADVRADFALRAHGDSMINARIHDGDIVFIRRQPQVEEGEIAAVLIEDEATLKRFKRYGDMVVLHAENPTYPDIVIKPKEDVNIRILGKAIAFQADVK